MTEPIDKDYAEFILNECISIEFTCETCHHRDVCELKAYQKKNSDLQPRGCKYYYPDPESIQQSINILTRRMK